MGTRVTAKCHQHLHRLSLCFLCCFCFLEPWPHNPKYPLPFSKKTCNSQSPPTTTSAYRLLMKRCSQSNTERPKRMRILCPKPSASPLCRLGALGPAPSLSMLSAFLGLT